MLLLSFLPLYFPDGRLVSRRWRWVVRLALFFCVTAAVFYTLTPGEIQNKGIVNPLGIEALQPFSDILETVGFGLYFILLFASAASLVVRFRGSGSVERQQIKWLAVAALAIPL
jgi:two-component system, NarL family, sensor kinase